MELKTRNNKQDVELFFFCTCKPIFIIKKVIVPICFSFALTEKCHVVVFVYSLYNRDNRAES